MLYRANFIEKLILVPNLSKGCQHKSLIVRVNNFHLFPRHSG